MLHFDWLSYVHKLSCHGDKVSASSILTGALREKNILNAFAGKKSKNVHAFKKPLLGIMNKLQCTYVEPKDSKTFNYCYFILLKKYRLQFSIYNYDLLFLPCYCFMEDLG